MVLSLSVRALFIALTFFAALLGAAPLTCLAETVLLDFSSPSCGPCQQMRPVVQRLLADGLPVREVDITREPQLASQYGVTQVPTFLVVVDGRVVDQAIGITSYDQLHSMLRRAMPAPAPRRSVRPLGQSPGVPTPGVPSTFAVQQASGLAEPQALNANTSRPSAIANPFGSRPVAPVAGSPRTSQLQSLHQRLLTATVKITVDDAQGKSAGTGTIVDSRGGEALVLTCGHLFRTSEGKGPITVTTFQVGTTGAVPSTSYSGRLIDFDLVRDLALVSIRPTAPVQAVAIAGTAANRLMPSTAVTSVGCNHGQNPTAIDSRVTSIDRYEGTPNVEVAGAPVEGRSGGGLFNAQGQLVGVCYAADRQSNEGLYASLPAIYAKLDSLGLAMIYQAIAAQPPMSVRGQEPEPSQFSMTTPAVTPAIAALPLAEQATLEEIQRRSANSEVICIIRSHDPAGKSEVITLNNVSPAFVDALTDPAQRPPTATAAAGQLLR